MTEQNEPHFPRPLSGAAVAHLPSGLVPSRTPLVGEVIELIPQDARHAAELYAAGHGTPEALKIWDYLAYGPWPDAAAYALAVRQNMASLDKIYYTLRRRETGRLCGQASYVDVNAQTGVIEIGHIWFAPELQRTRGATEALFLMLRHAMDDLGYRRMQWRCNALNAKSRAAARRLGFRFEGVFYNHMIFKGKNRDTAWYSILDDEWPEVRGIIEAWLTPRNFDEAGTARTSLSQSMQNRSPSRRASGE